MSVLIFSNEELEVLFDVINSLKICFHPKFAPDGKFKIFDRELSKKEIIIFADNNIISPICEIAHKGSLKNEDRLRKISAFVLWTKYINARITCGLGLLENDTANLSGVSSEYNRMRFLYAVDKIPPIVWKNLAFGLIDSVPDVFLYNQDYVPKVDYNFQDNRILLSIEAALIHISRLCKYRGMDGFNKFIHFFNWYTDNLEIGDCLMFYSAALFADIESVAMPKGIGSKDYNRIVKGIKNQAWDLAYLAFWSTFYYNESEEKCYMFATDDNTQKIISVNIIPPGQCNNAIYSIFHTKKQQQQLEDIFAAKLGNNRINPFSNMSESEIINKIKSIIEDEYGKLKNEI